MEMTEKEILKQIESEKRRIKRNADRMAELRAENAACRQAITYWNEELNRVKGVKPTPRRKP